MPATPAAGDERTTDGEVGRLIGLQRPDVLARFFDAALTQAG